MNSLKPKINSILHKIVNKFGFHIVSLKYADRRHIKVFKEYFKERPITGIEIGTWLGENAENLLKKLNISKIFLIDPYEEYTEYKENISNMNVLVKAKDESHERLKKFENKIIWIQKRSNDAIFDIKEKVDFVYIDGNHDYEFVKQDIENYYPLVKKGGILAGHDISWPGVFKAYSEFILRKNIEVHIDDVQFFWSPDWWIIKTDD